MKDRTNGPAATFFQLWWQKGGLFAIIFAVLTVGTTAFSMSALSSARDFDENGVVVEAEVTDKRTRKVQRDGKTQTEYYVTLRYMAGAEEIVRERLVPGTAYNSVRVGDPREVRYMDRTPTWVEFTIGENAQTGASMRWFALAVGLASLAALWWTARPATDAIRARRFGDSARARVLGVEKRRFQATRGYFMTFEDPEGRVGKTMPSKNNARFAPYPVGTEVEVFYGPKGRMWWVGDVGPRQSAEPVPDR